VLPKVTRPHWRWAHEGGSSPSVHVAHAGCRYTFYDAPIPVRYLCLPLRPCRRRWGKSFLLAALAIARPLPPFLPRWHLGWLGILVEPGCWRVGLGASPFPARTAHNRCIEGGSRCATCVGYEWQCGTQRPSHCLPRATLRVLPVVKSPAVVELESDRYKRRLAAQGSAVATRYSKTVRGLHGLVCMSDRELSNDDELTTGHGDGGCGEKGRTQRQDLLPISISGNPSNCLASKSGAFDGSVRLSLCASGRLRAPTRRPVGVLGVLCDMQPRSSSAAH